MAFTLEDAFKVFDAATGYMDSTRLAAENLNFKLDGSFADYVNLVSTNTYEWFDSLPCKYKSKSSLEKPKSGLKFLLSKEVVQNAIGKELCVEAMEKLDDCWKKHWKELVANRSKYDVIERPADVKRDLVLTEDDALSVVEEQEHDPTTMNALLKENVELKNTIKNLKEWLTVFVEKSTDDVILHKMYKALIEKY